MKETTDLINATAGEMKNCWAVGEGTGAYTCLLCGKTFEAGEIFPIGGRWFDARRAAQAHVEAEHGGVFEALCSCGKRYTGLTDNQRALLSMMRAGLTDAAIAQNTGTAVSTVRHQRFQFRERAKQARVYLALYELAEAGRENAKQEEGGEDLMEIPAGVKMVDERYVTTSPEEEKILESFFVTQSPLRLKNLSSKDKKKIVILKRIAQEFERGRRYTEPEVNEILRGVHEDFVALRRYLIEYGFMDRERDGSAYWLR